MDLFEDSKGNLWVTGSNGIWRWKPGPPQVLSARGSIEAQTSSRNMARRDPPAATNDGIEQILDGKIQTLCSAGRSGPLAAEKCPPEQRWRLWIGTR